MKKTLICLMGGIALTGCASIVDGSTQNINIVPSNSKDKVNATVITETGVQVIKLPGMIHTKKSGKDITIKIDEDENPCYETSMQIVSSSLNPFILGNVITGGVFGSTTDAATGAAWKYDDTVVVYPTRKDSCNVK
ncbi:MAG: hypothetical protein NC311_02875 [Muribaculaceae bacterium]|nr:hypothetical protein [Muribaculaceae bacterium]